MAWYDSIYTRLQGKLIKILGTLSLPTGSEDFPIAIANQLLGGNHGYLTPSEIPKIKRGFLQVPMRALTLDTTGNTTVIVEYFLTSLPEESDYVNGELQNWENFWNVTNNLGDVETVEQTKEFFRLYPLSLVDDILDNPNNYKPSTSEPVNEGWFINPPIETDSTIRFAIRGTFVGDILVGTYSDPYLLSGKPTLQDYITSDVGDDFKKSNGVVTPSSINLTANLDRGTVTIQDDVANNVTYLWERVRSDGTWALADKTTRTVNITPSDVSGTDTFQCTQTFQGLSFTERFTINDIADGIGIVIDVDSNVDGYIFNPENLTPKELTFTLYNNGTIVPFPNYTSIAFSLDGTAVTNGGSYLGETVLIADDVITITPNMVDQKLSVKATIVFNGVSYNRTIDIVIVPEAEQFLTIYHDEYFSPTTGLRVNPPIVANGTIEDNITPNGNWYVESGVNADTKHIATKRGAEDWVIIRIGGLPGEDGNAGAFNADIFRRAETKPTKPVGTITNGGVNISLNQALPKTTGWFLDDPETAGFLWKSRGLFVDLVGNGLYYLVGNWSEPKKVQGIDQIVDLSFAEKLFLQQNYQ